MSSKSHTKNGGQAKHTLTSQQSSPEGALDVSPWRGIPYGTVLRLDGLKVARACISSGRPSSALLYIEMYADSVFGGSTKLADIIGTKLATDFLGTEDIGGFGRSSRCFDSVERGTLWNGQQHYLSVLRMVYEEHNEADTCKAIDQLISDLSFLQISEKPPRTSMEGCFTVPLKRIEFLDSMLRAQGRLSDAVRSLADHLEELGLRATLDVFLSGVMSKYGDALETDDIAYLRDRWFECRLFTMQWNQISSSSDEVALNGGGNAKNTFGFVNTAPPGFASLYELVVSSVVALERSDIEECSCRLDEARSLLMDQIAMCGSRYGSIRTVLPLCEKLLVLADFQDLTSGKITRNELEERWSDASYQRGKAYDGQSDQDEFMECVKEITLRYLCKRAGSDPVDFSKALICHLRRVASNYIDLGRLTSAQEAIRRVYSIVSATKDPPNDLMLTETRLQEARLLERTGETCLAVRCADQVISKLRLRETTLSMDGKNLLVDGLLACGRWKASAKLEPTSSILKSYLNPASFIATSVWKQVNNEDNSFRATTALLAQSDLVSILFETISARVKSADWSKAGRSLKARIDEMNRLQEEIERSKGKKTKTPAARPREQDVYLQHLSREIKEIETERLKILSSLETYRCLALETIASALSITGLCDHGNLSKYVYRMIHICFATVDDCSWTHSADLIFREATEKIPSFRFVPLASQLFARLEENGPSDAFQSGLHKLLFRMCIDHPYHCLIQVITQSQGSDGRSAKSLNTTTTSKAKGALELVGKLRKNGTFVSQLLESYSVLASAYIHLSNTPTVEYHRSDAKRISFSAIGHKSYQRLDQCLKKSACPPCILTKPPPINPGCRYGNGTVDPVGAERIASFESDFSITQSGIHRPKIVVCLGTLGGSYRQLVKGEDEIRQDAVMEQIFGFVNELMGKVQLEAGVGKDSTKTSRKMINLVTYNVVPLSPTSGVLEWVEHCIPFGEFIVDKPGKTGPGQGIGAHSRYFPGEFSASKCRELLRTAPADEKRNIFDTISRNYSSCFRYFFVERFGSSAEMWYLAKTRYTRSVAVNSVVGHILGIGDRHCNNILIHERTGEVVHIDFGIVFEQGKLLATPERVPFRLTRNVVDGMGPLGVEGAFMSAAEETLTILKQNTNALLTILSAIVSDPLYKWRLNNTKARLRQDLKDEEGDALSFNCENDNDKDDKSERNEAAAHAIAKIQEKLLGYEDGTSGEQQGVEGQIKLLVNSARDPDNLCVMFPGWAPWM